MGRRIQLPPEPPVNKKPSSRAEFMFQEMMAGKIIQNFPDELNYVNAKLHPVAPKCGDHLRLFLEACLRADWENYPKLQPILRDYMLKYPADHERLAMERIDNGMGTEEDDKVMKEWWDVRLGRAARVND